MDYCCDPALQVIKNTEDEVIAVAMIRFERFWSFPEGTVFPNGREIPAGAMLPASLPKPGDAVLVIWPRVRLYMAPAYQASYAEILARSNPVESLKHAVFLFRRLGIRLDPWRLPPGYGSEGEVQYTPGWISVEPWEKLIETTTDAIPERLGR